MCAKSCYCFKKKEVEEQKLNKEKKLKIFKTKEKELIDNKVYNIKFDIKDLIFDNKFEVFTKEIQYLTSNNDPRIFNQ